MEVKLIKRRLPPFLFGLMLGLMFVYVYVKNRKGSIFTPPPAQQQATTIQGGKYSTTGKDLPSADKSASEKTSGGQSNAKGQQPAGQN